MIAILGDTHMPRGARELPRACAELLAEAELIVHTGDFTGLGVLRALQGFSAQVAAVHGNMDDPEVQTLLPEAAVVQASGVRVGVVHDAGPRAGRHARLPARFPGCDLIAYGHTHQPELTRVGEVWILNPGSPTERRRAPRHTMAIVEGGVPRLVEF